jgi:hypothetical protein
MNPNQNQIESPQQLSSRERIARATNALNQPVVCPDCGSTWFFEVVFNQYSKSVYSSAPGGDHKVISVMPQYLRMCACGRPITPNLSGIRGGRTPNGEMASFFDALQGAVNYRTEVAAGKKATQALVNQFATLNDVNEVKEKLATNGTGDEALKSEIAELRAQLEGLEAAVNNTVIGDAAATKTAATETAATETAAPKVKKGGKA